MQLNHKGVTQMDDNLLLMMEGRWHLQFSGCPIWLKNDVNTVTFHFGAMHQGEELVLEDRVEYIRNGKMRFRLGIDHPVDGIPRTFQWKGKGVNRTFRNHFEVAIINEKYLVLFFEKTITSPTAIDILTRARIITESQKETIFQAVRENITIRDYLDAVRPVTLI